MNASDKREGGKKVEEVKKETIKIKGLPPFFH